MASYKRCTRGLEVQSIIFPASWSAREVRAWAREHGARATKLDRTGQSVRLRQRPPSAFTRGSFRTITISANDNIKAVVGCPLPGRESDRRRTRRDDSRPTDAERLAACLRSKGYDAVVLNDPARRARRSDPEIKVGDVYDEFGHEWRVTRIRGKDVYVEREDRDAFGKNVPERRIFHPSAFRSLRKIRSGTGRDVPGRRRDADYRFEALYEGDDQWRSGGGESFSSPSDAIRHAERVVNSPAFDAKRARIVAPNGKTIWTHYPSPRPRYRPLTKARRRDVSRYDLSPEAKRWMASYQDEGVTPETREAFERLSRFDKAAVRFLLSENGGPPSRDRLSTRARNRLRSSQFALPEQRRLPIHNASHARNASARLEQMKRRGTVNRYEYRRARRAIDRAERRFGIERRRIPGRN
jgi:hypothetical protein